MPLVNAATHNNPELHVLSHAWFKALPEADVALQRPVPNHIAYLQYTSGSTRFPRGVIITHREVMANLRAISHDGIKLRPGYCCVSWLPFYHDMGLVGFLLTPVATQLSVDYLRTQDFAMRPLQWLKLISKNRGTVSVAPPFGYEFWCQRRVNEKDLAELDLPAGASLVLVLSRSPPQNNSINSLNVSVRLTLTIKRSCRATDWQKMRWLSASLMKRLWGCG
ncbi:AMP-binding protein [Escherichia coli]